VITKKTIRNASDMQNAQTILNRMPSINAYSEGPNGINTHITFRSFNSGQFSETFDGMSLNNMFNGGVTDNGNVRGNNPVTLNDVQSIKVYNGINNPSVNSYNSLGGTIGFMPRQPSKKEGIKLGAGYGSFNTFDWNAAFNTGSLGGYKALFAYNRQTSSGWQIGTANMNTNYYYAGILPYDDHKGSLSTYIIVNRFNGYLPESDPLNFVRSDQKIPLNHGYEHAKDQDITAILGNKIMISRHVLFNTKIFGRFDHFHRVFYGNVLYDNTTLFPYSIGYEPHHSLPGSNYPVPPSYNPQAVFGSVANGTQYALYHAVSSTLGVSPSLQFILPHNLVTIGGNAMYGIHHVAEFYYGTLNMPEIAGYNDAWDDRDSRIQASVYGQDVISLFHGSLHVTPGLKYVYSDMTANNVAPGFYRATAGSLTSSAGALSPTIGVNWSPFHHFSLYASWGKNTKFAGVYDSYTSIGEKDKSKNYVTVPVDLAPEYVLDYELGARYERRGASVSVNAYREDFQNTFVGVYDPSTGIRYTVNGGNSEHEGVEIAGRLSLGRLFGRWSVWGNYSYNRATYTSSTYGNIAGKISETSPDCMYNVGINWQHRHSLSADIRGKYTSHNGSIPGFFNLNMGVHDSFKINNYGIDKVKLSLHLDNLLNRHYYYSAGYRIGANRVAYLAVQRAMPRYIYGSLKLVF
jgi:Outer membrane receptor proteins, mostly Fe transport